MEEKLNLQFPVIVEGKYDKAKLSTVVSSAIIPLDGFSVFNNTEKQQLLKKLSKEKGIILLADSDKAGNFIRGKLKGILNGIIYNVYSPVIKGKERRKVKPSADGLLGVEGIDSSVLYNLLKPFEGNEAALTGAGITKTRFYSDGFSGGVNSAEKRKRLAEILELPETLTANALLEAINLLVSFEEYESALMRINNE